MPSGKIKKYIYPFYLVIVEENRIEDLFRLETLQVYVVERKGEVVCSFQEGRRLLER